MLVILIMVCVLLFNGRFLLKIIYLMEMVESATVVTSADDGFFVYINNKVQLNNNYY